MKESIQIQGRELIRQYIWRWFQTRRGPISETLEHERDRQLLWQFLSLFSRSRRTWSTAPTSRHVSNP